MRVTVEKTVNVTMSEVDAMALKVILYTVMGKACFSFAGTPDSYKEYASELIGLLNEQGIECVEE